MSIPFILARNGFNVFLGNNRGSKYSRTHETLRPDKSRDDAKKYFDYSWYDFGEHDVLGNVDYILRLTGKKKIAYIGYS